jgi:hypothetical protein
MLNERSEQGLSLAQSKGLSMTSKTLGATLAPQQVRGWLAGLESIG